VEREREYGRGGEGGGIRLIVQQRIRVLQSHTRGGISFTITIKTQMGNAIGKKESTPPVTL